MRAHRGSYETFLFGTPEFDVRWNRTTRVLSLHLPGARASDPPVIAVDGDLGERVAAMLIVLHMRQELRQNALSEIVRGRGDHPWNQAAGWYRCGRYVLPRPAIQEAA